MNFFNYFIESVNKFNTAWQDVRVEAKKIKDVDAKINLVKKFLIDNPSKANLGRIVNWTRMTKLGYKNSSPESCQKFDDFLEFLDVNIDKFSEEDSDVDLNSLPAATIQKIYKDLVLRRNDFQHGGKRPKNQVDYLNRIKEIAQNRGIDLIKDPQA